MWILFTKDALFQRARNAGLAGGSFFSFSFFLVILTMVHHSLQSLDDGIHGGIVFFSELQEKEKKKKKQSGKKGLQEGLQDRNNNLYS